MHHLLTMRPNLQWREDYVDGGESDVIPMLAGYAGSTDGPAAAHSPPGERCGKSMGLWTAQKTAVGDPGQLFNYSSGFSNLISDIPTCQELIDRIMNEAEAIIRQRLAGFLDA